MSPRLRVQCSSIPVPHGGLLAPLLLPQIKFRRRLYDMDELAVFYHQDAILEFFSVRQATGIVETHTPIHPP